MRFGDRVSGLLAAALGLAVALHARTFPPMPGQSVGPSLFPTIIGICLIGFGMALVIGDLRRGTTPWVSLDEWVKRPPMVANFVVVVAALIFFIVAVEPVGFFLTSMVFLGVLMVAFGARRSWILPLSLLVTIVIHYGFYTLLRVPLPWGVFQAVAW